MEPIFVEYDGEACIKVPLVNSGRKKGEKQFVLLLLDDYTFYSEHFEGKPYLKGRHNVYIWTGDKEEPLQRAFLRAENGEATKWLGPRRLPTEEAVLDYRRRNMRLVPGKGNKAAFETSKPIQDRDKINPDMGAVIDGPWIEGERANWQPHITSVDVGELQSLYDQRVAAGEITTELREPYVPTPQVPKLKVQYPPRSPPRHGFDKKYGAEFLAPKNVSKRSLEYMASAPTRSGRTPRDKGPRDPAKYVLHHRKVSALFERTKGSNEEEDYSVYEDEYA